MKEFTFAICFLFLSGNVRAVNDENRISFYPLINSSVIDFESRLNWQAHLESALNSNGLLNLSENRFVCGLTIVTNQMEMSPNGDMVAFESDVIISVVDIRTMKKYGNFRVDNLKSVGINQTRAMKMLASKFKEELETSDFNFWIDSMKVRILNDYSDNCTFIIKEAMGLSRMRRFDEALYKLNEVPVVLRDCYFNVKDSILQVYLNKANFECQQKLASSRIMIASNQFNSAANLLIGIDPGVACYAEVERVIQEISKQICSAQLGAARGAWASLDYEMASFYLRNISAASECANEAERLRVDILKYARERENHIWQFEIEKFKLSASIERSRINAARDVAVAFANNQPINVTKIVAIYPW
jgi:hypothetical protein